MPPISGQPRRVLPQAPAGCTTELERPSEPATLLGSDGDLPGQFGGVDTTPTTRYHVGVNVVDAETQIQEALRRLPVPERDRAAQDVISYLALLADRERHLEATSRLPMSLAETEGLVEGFEVQYRGQIRGSLPMLSASQVIEIIGSVGDNRGRLKRLRDSSSVIAVRLANHFAYPEFQFDKRTHSIFNQVSVVNRWLGAATDPWGAIAWWTSAHPRLGGRRPIDDPDDPVLSDLLTAEAEAGF